MTEPGIHITVHDQFKRGDRVRLVHTEGREFVTDATLVIEQDSTSVTFAGVPDRAGFEVIVDRVVSADAPVELVQSDGASADVGTAQAVQHFNGVALLATWEERPAKEET